MKGQHLALESIATFALALIAAIGVVSIFGNLNNQVVVSTQETQAELVADRVRSGILQISYASSEARSFQQIQLPEQIGGKDYQIAVEEDEILVFTENENYQQTYNIANPMTEVTGTADGGNVRIFKSPQGIRLRSGR